MLMDEPFGDLDPITRNELQDEFLRLRDLLDMTIVLVTHDLTEAFKMGHKVLLLKQGRIEQYSAPKDFVHAPTTEYVETFCQSQLSTFHSLQGLINDR